jgi:hypothetical protein
MAAFCKWRFPHAADETIVEPEKSKDALPEGFNEGLLQELVGKLSASRKRHLDNSKDYRTGLLSNPSFEIKNKYPFA